MGDLVDFLRKKSHVAESAIKSEAATVIAMTSEERSAWIMHKMNMLVAIQMGQQNIDKSKWTQTRKQIHERENLHGNKGSMYAMNDNCTEADLVEWLTEHYAIETYCKDNDLENEWLRELARSRTKTDPDSDE